MALFNRNKSSSVMPEEVQNFYAAERRQKKGTAWLLAIATLLATFALAAALFYGGKFVYNALFSKDDPAPAAQTESKEAEQPVSNSGSTQSPSSASPSTTPSTPAPGTSSPQTSTQTQPSTSTAAPSPAPSALVNTGPGDE